MRRLTEQIVRITPKGLSMVKNGLRTGGNGKLFQILDCVDNGLWYDVMAIENHVQTGEIERLISNLLGMRALERFYKE